MNETPKLSGARDYSIAILIAAVFIVAIGTYLFVRRGYMFDAPLSAGVMYIPNKVLASVGVLMIGLSFLVGPVARYFQAFDTWLNYRKEIGIVGGILALSHGIVSAFFVPKKFSVEKLFAADHLFTTLAGFIGVSLLLFLIVISFQKMITVLGGARWWFFQRWGVRLVVLATLLHVIPMKWEGWERWFRVGVPQTPELVHPWMTPASILVTLFLVWVTLVRFYESAFLFRSWGIATKEISLDENLMKRGRQFFLTSFWMLILLYGVVIFRWQI